IPHIKLINMPLSNRLTESFNLIPNYRKSIVLYSCYEPSVVPTWSYQCNYSHTRLLCDWLSSKTTSTTIENCNVSCSFQDLLCDLMQSSSEEINYTLNMRDNIVNRHKTSGSARSFLIRYEKVIPFPENIWRFKHLEIDTNVLH
ncbi:hypothetical protein PFISCL1PPCAC_3862, partial [Pristionchus fissidentatus]